MNNIKVMIRNVFTWTIFEIWLYSKHPFLWNENRLMHSTQHMVNNHTGRLSTNVSIIISTCARVGAQCEDYREWKTFKFYTFSQILTGYKCHWRHKLRFILLILVTFPMSSFLGDLEAKGNNFIPKVKMGT